MQKKATIPILLAIGILLYLLISSFLDSNTSITKKNAEEIVGVIEIDGSSTVFPITESVAESFQAKHPKVSVTIGLSGTGGGFKKFCTGQTQINNSSRQISKDEIELAKMNQIKYLELLIAFDGISIVTHKKTAFIKDLTIEELKLIWQENSTVKLWNEVRPEWPEIKITLFSPGKDSGTSDYFKEVILGKGKLYRSEVTTSEDDNLLVDSIANTEGSLGFFGFAYYHENAHRLNLIGIKSKPETRSVEPSLETIKNGSYFPLSRPLYIYVNEKYINQELMRSFLSFYLNNAFALVKKVGYVPLEQKAYLESEEKILKFKNNEVPTNKN